MEHHSLICSQIQLVVGTKFDILLNFGVLGNTINENSTLIYTKALRVNQLITQFPVGGNNFMIRVIGVENILICGIVCHNTCGIVDPDGIQEQVVAVAAGHVVHEFTVGRGQSDFVVAVIHASLGDDGDLVQVRRILTLGCSPFAVFKFVTPIGIHEDNVIFHDLPVTVSVRLEDLRDQNAGVITGDGDHIKASAVEFELGGGVLICADRDLGGTAHGEVGIDVIGTVKAVNVVSIIGTAQLIIARTVHFLHIRVGSCDGCGISFLLRLNDLGIGGGAPLGRVTVMGIEVQEFILIIDRCGGNDSDRGIQATGQKILTVIVVDCGYIIEGQRLGKLHAVFLIEGKSDGRLVFHRCRADLHAVDHQRNAGFAGDVIVMPLVYLHTGGLIGTQTHHTAGQGIVFGDIDHHIQAEVHHDRVLHQFVLPLYSESNRGIGEVKAGFHFRAVGLGDDGVPLVVLVQIIRIGPVEEIRAGGLGSERCLGLPGSKGIAHCRNVAVSIHCDGDGAAALAHILGICDGIFAVIADVGAGFAVLLGIGLGVKHIGGIGRRIFRLGNGIKF